MGKRFLSMSVLLLLTWGAEAERIDKATARRVAENVARVMGDGIPPHELSLVHAAAPERDPSRTANEEMEGVADFFVFNVHGGRGFMIISGDDRAYPLLAYADRGSFVPDSLPENLRAMLTYYQAQINWAERNELVSSEEITSRWLIHARGGANGFFRSRATRHG